MVLAEHFADQSRAEAELASAKASALKANAVNDEMKRSNSTLVARRSGEAASAIAVRGTNMNVMTPAPHNVIPDIRIDVGCCAATSAAADSGATTRGANCTRLGWL